MDHGGYQETTPKQGKGEGQKEGGGGGELGGQLEGGGDEGIIRMC